MISRPPAVRSVAARAAVRTGRRPLEFTAPSAPRTMTDYVSRPAGTETAWPPAS